MLGWHVSVYKITEPSPLAGVADVSALLVKLSADTNREALRNALVTGEKLAVWQADVDGLAWVNELVKDTRALQLAFNGYPNLFVALARDLTRQILQGPPRARSTWTAGLHDVLTPKWQGKTVIETAAIADCSPAEWLVVQAWDES